MKSKAKSRSFSVTIVEDRNTCGLCYDESDGKDRFDELCLAYGQDATAAAADRGGSYGFGKGVYEEASDCNTFIVYSVYEPNPNSPSDPGSHARLFGCATFDGHTMGKTNFKGRALFGVYKKRHGLTECRPILDDDAHRMAKQLGFLERKPNDYGTSIMIIGSTIDIDDLRTSVEDYWWPRIYSNQLSVELWEDDDDVRPPEPRDREDLRPYLRCYSLIEEKMAPDEEERLMKLQRESGSDAQPGQLALKALPQSDEDSLDDVESDTHLDSTVALIRSGPKMVVEYLDPGGRAAANFAGVFLSHPDVEQELHLSEPPAHDSWAPNSPRLSEAYATDSLQDGGCATSRRVHTPEAQVEDARIQTQSRSRSTTPSRGWVAHAPEHARQDHVDSRRVAASTASWTRQRKSVQLEDTRRKGEPRRTIEGYRPHCDWPERECSGRCGGGRRERRTLHGDGRRYEEGLFWGHRLGLCSRRWSRGRHQGWR